MKYYDYDKLELEGEIWKDVVGYEDFYEVSSYGRVRTKPRIVNSIHGGRRIFPKIRKPKFSKSNGYLLMELNLEGVQKTVSVHSLVGEAFYQKVEKKGAGKTITFNHIDGNKLNNRADNLEVISLADNIRHAFKNGLYSNCHKVKYNGVEYYSKTELRRQLKMSEKKMNKLIAEGEIELL